MSKPKLNQSKNIVISTQCFPPVIGGIENLMKGLANNLHKKNFNIFVFADGKNSLDEEKYDKQLSYEIIRYRGLKIIRKRRKSIDIKKFINFKKNINSIFCDSWKSAENLIKIKLVNTTKIFCLAHGNDILIKRSLIKKRRIKKIFLKVKYIIANSYFTKKKIINLGINSKKIKVIYPGIDKINPYNLKKKIFLKKFKKSTPSLITIARLEKRKNHKKVIYAVNDLVKEYKNLLYIIVGDGPEKSKLTKIVSRLNLKKNIKFLRKVNDNEKASLFNISDLHIMPTIDDKHSFSIEGFGISYIEAGIFGVPSISSGIGGTSESVINNKTGLICNGDNVQSIKNSIIKIWGNKKKYAIFSKNAKKYAQSFLWEKKIQSYIKLLKN